ncbi:MAG: AAA family ATPase [Deltaproteobacteria bacterium]|nr:AAA family ATPase [Nannocystaceae bacterium]
MRVTELLLSNFRGFVEAQVTFDPRLTVLVGVNGTGKSSVLEAIADLMHDLCVGVHGRALGDEVLRNDSTRGEIHLSFSWGVDEVGARTRGFGVDAPSETLNYMSLVDPRAETIPIGMLLPTSRFARDQTPASTVSSAWGRQRAWEGAFDARADFADFFLWFREREDIENERRTDDPSHRDVRMNAVRSAIERLVDGISGIRVRRPQDVPAEGAAFRKATIVASKDGGRLAFDQLSEGERATIAMTGDIARRLAIANPEVVDPLAGEGIVMIDEIELHLHPKWQAEVLDRLLATFPNLQFIVTTHSPLVLRHVPAQQIRILEGFEVYSPAHPVEGRDAGSILSDVFDIDPLPQETRDAVDHISGLIDADRFEDARAELQRLSDKLGNLDVEVTRLRTVLDLMAS